MGTAAIRVLVIRVTDAGRELFSSLHPAWEQAQVEVGRLLGESGVEAIHKLHLTLRETLAGHS